MNSHAPPAAMKRRVRHTASGRRFLSSGAIVTAAASLALLLPHAALAQTFTWNGTTGNFDDATKYVGGVAPTDGGLAGYVLNFNGTAAFTATNNFLTQPFVLTNLNLSNTVSGSLITGGSLRFQTGPGPVAPTINQTGAGGFTINSGLVLDADTTFGGTGSGQLTLNGAISGAGGILKTSSNTLALNNTASSYTGATQIQTGSIRYVGNVGVSANSAFGNAASPIAFGTAGTAGAGTLFISYVGNANGTFDRALDMSQAPGLTSGTAGRQTIAIDNLTNGLIPNNGTNTTSFLGTNNNTLTLNGAIAIGSSAPATAGRRQQFVAVQVGSRLIVNGLISGTTSGGVNVNGENRGIGTVQFTNPNNSYTASTTIGNGTLLIGGDVTAAAGSPSLLGTNLALNLADGATTAANQTTGGAANGVLSNLRVLIDGNFSVNRNITLTNGASFGIANIIGDQSINSYTLGSTANNTGGTARYTGTVAPNGIVTNQNLNLTTGSATGILSFDGVISSNTNVGAVNVNINQNINPQTGLAGAVSTGTVVLNATNTFDGTVSVLGGTAVLGANANAALGRNSGGASVATLTPAAGTPTGSSGTPNIVNYGGANVSSGATLDLNGKSVGGEQITLNGGSLINNNAATSSLNPLGNIPAITINSTGTPQNYPLASPLTVSFAGGGGTGAAAIARLNIATIGVPTGGSGYAAATTKVFISINGAAAVNATDNIQSGFNAVPVIVGGAVTGVTIRSMGGNFTTTPVITIVDTATTPGTGATATAQSLVTGLDVTNSGTGYTSAPNVTLSSGDAVVAASPVLVNFAQSSSIGGSGNITVGGPIAGAAGSVVTKIGAGTVTLGGVNTFAGPTVVQGGVLNVTGSIAASSGLTIAGGTVAGTGTLPGVALQSGARLLAGPTTGTGTLSATSLNFDGGGTLAFLLGADPITAGASDRLTLSGAFNKGSAGLFNFDFAGSSTILSETSPYTLVTFAPNSTSFTAGDVAGFQVSNLPAGYAGTFALDSANGALRLNVAAVAVPEPGSIAFLLTGGIPVGGLLLRRRYARKA